MKGHEPDYKKVVLLKNETTNTSGTGYLREEVNGLKLVYYVNVDSGAHISN